jgi:hypothetical protein
MPLRGSRDAAAERRAQGALEGPQRTKKREALHEKSLLKQNEYFIEFLESADFMSLRLATVHENAPGDSPP